MKTTLLFITLMLLLALGASAQIVGGELDWPDVQNSVFTNNLVSTNITATTIQTNTFSGYKAIWHTFEFDWTASGTNACTNFLDASVSGNNWTNLYSIGGTASYSGQFQYVGVAVYFRERFVMESTNGTMNTYYAGH